ncbi:MAG: hypothetical protein U9R08_06160 [Nanoarchaeota archaeon]|nr:hypothetical protein [Nanoarchaeota archaeon]
MSLIDKIKNYIPSTRTLLKGTAIGIGLGLFAMYAAASTAEARTIKFEIKGKQNPYQVLQKKGGDDQKRVYKFLGKQKKPNSGKTLAHCLGGKYKVTIDDSTNEVTKIKGKLPRWYNPSVNAATTAQTRQSSRTQTRTAANTTKKIAQDNSYKIKVNYYDKNGQPKGSAFEVVPNGKVPEQGWNLEHKGDNFIFNKALNRFRVKYGKNKRPNVKQFFGEKYLKYSRREIFGLEGVVKKGKVGDNISIFLVKESKGKPVKELEKYPISANNQAHTNLKQDITDYLSFASKESKKAFKHQRKEVLETLSNTSNIRVPTMGNLKTFLLGGSTPTTPNRNTRLPYANTGNTYVGASNTASIGATGLATAGAAATIYTTNPVSIRSVPSSTTSTTSTAATRTVTSTASTGRTTPTTLTITSIASTTPTTSVRSTPATTKTTDSNLTMPSYTLPKSTPFNINSNNKSTTPKPKSKAKPVTKPTTFTGNEKTNKKKNQYDWGKTIKINLGNKVIKFQVQGKPHSYRDGIFNSGEWGFKSFIGNQKRNTGYKLVKDLYKSKSTEINAIKDVNGTFTYQKKSSGWEKVVIPVEPKVVISKPTAVPTPTPKPARRRIKLRSTPKATPKRVAKPTPSVTPTPSPTPKPTTVDDSTFDGIFENPEPRFFKPTRRATPTPTVTPSPTATPTPTPATTASGTVTASSTPKPKTWKEFDIPPSFIPLIPKHITTVEQFQGSTKNDIKITHSPTKVTLTPKNNIIVTYDDEVTKPVKVPPYMHRELKRLRK